MTMNELAAAFYLPEQFIGNTAPQSISAATNRQFNIQQVPVSGMLQKVLVTSSSGAGSTSLRLRIETVSGSSFTDQTNTLIAPGAEAVFTTLAANYYEVALDTPVAVVKGQLIDVTVRPEVYVGTVGLTRATVASSPPFPFFGTSTTTTSMNRGSGATPNSLLMIDGAWRAQNGIIPVSGNYVSHALMANSNPNEVGNRVTMPFGATISGYWYSVPTDPGSNYVASVYDAAGSVLVSDPGLPAIGILAPAEYTFSSPVTVAAGDVIRVAIRAASATTVNLRSLPAANSAHFACMPGRGAAYRTMRGPSGVWTDDPLSLASVGLVLSHIDIPTGSSGAPASNRKVKIGGTFVTV